jgi:signal transduction histidine kinase
LATYRSDRDQRDLTPSDLDDMRLLIGPEASRKGLQVDWTNGLTEPLRLPASSVRQILLNLLLNATAASPAGSRLRVAIWTTEVALSLEVEDEGEGLPQPAAHLLMGKTDRPVAATAGVGLGLWLTRRLIVELHGVVDVARGMEGGALVRITFPIAEPEALNHVA